jgi:hypothetical protein
MTRRMSAPLPARVAAIVLTAVVATAITACADEDGGDGDSATASEDATGGDTDGDGAGGDGDAAETEAEGNGAGDGAGGDDEDVLLLGASFEPQSTLWSVSLKADELLATVTAGGLGVELTDVAAAPDGTVYGLSFDRLYTIDPATGRGTEVGPVGVGDVNALVVTPEGRLLAGANEGALVEIDPATGAGTVVGGFGGGLTSSGDLAVGPDGSLYAAVADSTGETGIIATVDPETGTATRVVDLPFPEVYGLAFADDDLYALTTATGTSCPSGALVRVDIDAADAEELRCLDFPPGGATAP